jgi:apolipoprotein N-acyltransferase
MERFDTWPELIDLTRKGLEGAGRVDLVCWGETLWPWYLDSGAPWGSARPPPWWNVPSSQGELQRKEAEAIRHGFLDKKLLPPGCSFLAGAEVLTPYRGEIRRANGAVLWGPDGKRIGWGAKLHLVPGGETMAGLERWAWVRNAAHELAGYVPDLVAGSETSVVDLPVRDFRAVRLGLSVCFDNTYDDPYTGPLRRGPLDAHLILSNEAWYGESCEYDHMLAFSRLAAIESGRAVARVTNSGISALFGPDGAELARLRVGGKDRMVGGSLLVTLPVPTLGHAGDRTPFVCAEPYLRWLAVLCPFLLLALWRRRAVTPP